MRVDLRQIETVVISLPGDARRAAAATLCETHGLTYRFIDAIACKPHVFGCGLSHVGALRSTGAPVLILEDDIAATADFRPELDAPDDADAVYIGTSSYGAVEPVDWVGFSNMVAAEPSETPGFVRVHNMLGAHAILYLTDEFKRAADHAMVDVMATRGWDPDRGLAMIQPGFKVYALVAPMLYQSAALQSSPERARHQEAVTLAPPPLYDVGRVQDLVMDGVGRPVRLVRENGALTWRFV